MQEALLSVTRRSPAPVKGIDNGRMAIKGPGCCWRSLNDNIVSECLCELECTL